MWKLLKLSKRDYQFIIFRKCKIFFRLNNAFWDLKNVAQKVLWEGKGEGGPIPFLMLTWWKFMVYVAKWAT